MDEVQFVNDPQPTGPEAKATRLRLFDPTVRRWVGPKIVSVVAFALAAVAAIVAPFDPMYTVTNSRGSFGGADGWGGGDSVGLAHGHGVRFGILLWICAGGFLLLAALCGALVRHSLRTEGSDRLTASTAIGVAAAPGLLAGVFASIVLSAQSQIDQLQRLTGNGQTALVSGTHVRLGACVWLSMIALGLGLIGTYVHLRYAATPRPADADRRDLSIDAETEHLSP